MKIFITVTHLHGTGHFIRAILIAEECVRKGHEVVVVSGGFPLPHIPVDHRIRFVQLPPVRSNGVDFSILYKADGPVDADYLAARQELLCATLKKEQPDCVITELFPFGRNILRGEFIFLLQESQGLSFRPLVLSSVRDVLEPPSSLEKTQRTLELLSQFYNGVLVHGDESFLPLFESWPNVHEITIPVYYTGYITRPVVCCSSRPVKSERGNILVTAGGGPLGAQLFEAALDCCKNGVAQDRTWRFLVGGADHKAVIDALYAKAENVPNLVIESVRPDFKSLLDNAYLVIQRIGYNAFIDCMDAKRPTVLCPFDEGGEQEQAKRAMAMRECFGFPMLTGKDLTCSALEQAIYAALIMPPPDANTINLGGCVKTVALIQSAFDTGLSLREPQ